MAIVDHEDQGFRSELAEKLDGFVEHSRPYLVEVQLQQLPVRGLRRLHAGAREEEAVPRALLAREAEEGGDLLHDGAQSILRPDVMPGNRNDLDPEPQHLRHASFEESRFADPWFPADDERSRSVPLGDAVQPCEEPIEFAFASDKVRVRGPEGAEDVGWATGKELRGRLRPGRHSGTGVAEPWPVA